MPINELKKELATELSFITRGKLITSFIKELPTEEKKCDTLLDIIDSRSSVDKLYPLYIDPINTITMVGIIKQIGLATSQLPKIYSKLYSDNEESGYRFILGVVSEKVLQADNPADFEIFKTLVMSLSDDKFLALIEPQNIHSKNFLIGKKREEISQQIAALRDGFIEFPATSLRSVTAASAAFSGIGEEKSGASKAAFNH